MRPYIAFACQYQAKKSDEIDDIGPSVGEQIALNPFSHVLKHLEIARTGYGLLAIHTTTVDLYTRLWW